MTITRVTIGNRTDCGDPLKTYQVVGPNRRIYGGANSWNDAVDNATDLSLRWGVLFSVVPTTERTPLFKKEHQAVLTASLNYIEMTRLYPSDPLTERARATFIQAKKALNNLLNIHDELIATDYWVTPAGNSQRQPAEALARAPRKRKPKPT